MSRPRARAFKVASPMLIFRRAAQQEPGQLSLSCRSSPPIGMGPHLLLSGPDVYQHTAVQPRGTLVSVSALKGNLQSFGYQLYEFTADFRDRIAERSRRIVRRIFPSSSCGFAYCAKNGWT